MVRKLYAGDPPGRPLVRTLSSDCRGSSPWSGNLDPTSYMVQPKKKKKILCRLIQYQNCRLKPHETIPLRMSFPHSVALVGDAGRLRCGERGPRLAAPGGVGDTGPGQGLPSHVSTQAACTRAAASPLPAQPRGRATGPRAASRGSRSMQRLSGSQSVCKAYQAYRPCVPIP